MGGLFGGSTAYIEGNRVSEFQINGATYGECVPVILGTTRISGNVIDWADFKEHAHTDRQKVGKGGGGQTTVTTTYTYTVKVLIGLCEGEIKDVLRVWRDKEIVTLPATGLNLFKGAAGQQPWTGLQNYGSGTHYLPYSRLAYVAGEIDLHSYGSLPNFNFEVVGQLADTGDGLDVNPADAIKYIVTNNISGLGYDGNAIDETALDNYRRYCRAADIYISLPVEVQDGEAVNLINEILTATNAIGIWSDKKLKIIPLAEGTLTTESGTWVPNLEPLFDLTDDDFHPDSGEPAVTFERADNSECYNEVSIEFFNRANAYEKEVAKYQVLSDISRRGLVPAAKKTMYFLHTKARALYVAEQLAVRSIYTRNTYNFRLDWSFGLLEPGDIVTITNEKLGLYKTLVRITEISEDSDGMLNVTALSIRAGAASPSTYPDDPPRVTINTNVDPGGVMAPEIFELPYQTNQREIGIALCGSQPKWGGAQIWYSFDNEAYEYAGEVWAPARYGVTTGAMSAESAAVGVELKYPAAQILGSTAASAQAGATISLIGGEWVTYENAELTAEGRYNLSGMTRGLYGVAPAAHAAGERFVIIDNAIFHHVFRVEDTGRTVYLKFPSFNVYGSNLQALDEVEHYEYTIEGPTPVMAPANLYATGIMKGIKLTWDPPDGNADVTGYEVWSSSVDGSIVGAVKIGETRDMSFLHEGLGVLQTRWYWVRAYDYGHNFGPLAGPVYATTKALEMEDIPDQSIEPGKFIPQLERVIADVQKLSVAGVVSAIVTDKNRDKAATATQELNTKVVEGFQAEATARTELAARINENTAALVEEQTARAEADRAEATARETLAVQMSQNIAAAIQTEAEARAAADRAEASQRETLATQVGGNTAAIQTNAIAIATVDGKVEGTYSVVVDANGRIAGIMLGSNGQTSEMVVLADKFKIAKADGSATQIFTVDTVTGFVQIVGSLIASGSITGDKIFSKTKIQIGDSIILDGANEVIQIGTNIVLNGKDGSFF